MKTINLYFDFEFTSLSPDAQPISVGIVSDDNNENNLPIGVVSKYQYEFVEYVENKGEHVTNKNLTYIGRYKRITSFNDLHGRCFEDIFILSLPHEFENHTKELEVYKNLQVVKKLPESKSFYAEFSDFDINRCDDWVKENVVDKLQYFNKPEKRDFFIHEESFVSFIANSHKIRRKLMLWLTIFRDYKIQFICDCGTYDWYWMVQLLAVWDKKENSFEINPKNPFEIPAGFDAFHGSVTVKTGLPKLPENISPVPFDLNDLIAIKKGLTPAESFNLNREELAFGKSFPSPILIIDTANFSEEQLEEIASDYRKSGGIIFPKDGTCTEIKTQNPKHNALWDARVIKEIYQTLK